MSAHTALDRRHLASMQAPEDDRLRLRFYERLIESELFLLLTKDADGDRIEPQLFPTETGPAVLVFDLERRLADFVGKPAPYAMLSGRQVIRLLDGRNIGLGLNLGIPASETILPAHALSWLARLLDQQPMVAEGRLREVSAPQDPPDALVTGLGEKMTSASGLARRGFLAGATYDDGRRGHLFAFEGAVGGAQSALATALGDVLTFSGIDAAEMDVVFLEVGDPTLEAIRRVGIRFEIPEPQQPEFVELKAPGMDPDEPPILT